MTLRVDKFLLLYVIFLAGLALIAVAAVMAYEGPDDTIMSVEVADDSYVTMAVSSLVNRPYLLRGDGRILRPP